MYPISGRGKGVLLSVAVMAPMVALVAYSPTLYRLFCEITGYDGTVRRTVAAAPAEVGRPISIRFDANVAPGLPWSFQPEQRVVAARLGEPITAYYTARNLSDTPVVARAVFNVSPFNTGIYFFKVECFCFTEQKLAPGEDARMPVVLWVDPELDRDKDAQQTQEITLSYTFFPQKSLSDADVAAAQSLKAGSDAREESLKRQEFFSGEAIGDLRR